MNIFLVLDGKDWLGMLQCFLIQQFNIKAGNSPGRIISFPLVGTGNPDQGGALSTVGSRNLKGEAEQKSSNMVDGTWTQRASAVSSVVLPHGDFQK